jgi:hypothetical protein
MSNSESLGVGIAILGTVSLTTLWAIHRTLKLILRELRTQTWWIAKGQGAQFDHAGYLTNPEE